MTTERQYIVELSTIALLLLLIMWAAFMAGCGGDQVTRIETPTPPPTDPPDNGGLLTLQGAGYWSGNEMGNLRCAMRLDLTPNGNWGFDFQWGCTAGLDEDELPAAE